MYNIGFDIIQQPLIVRNDDTTCFGSLQFVHTLGYNTQRINIKTGIRFIQNTQLRLQHSHLEDLIALLLTTAESLVYRTVCQFIIQFHHSPLLAHQLQELTGCQCREAFIFTLLVYRRTHKVHHTDSGNLHRILERQKQTFMTAILRTQSQQIFSFKSHRTFRYLKSRIAYQHRRKGTLSGTVGSHNSMNFTFLYA